MPYKTQKIVDRKLAEIWATKERAKARVRRRRQVREIKKNGAKVKAKRFLRNQLIKHLKNWGKLVSPGPLRDLIGKEVIITMAKSQVAEVFDFEGVLVETFPTAILSMELEYSPIKLRAWIDTKVLAVPIWKIPKYRPDRSLNYYLRYYTMADILIVKAAVLIFSNAMLKIKGVRIRECFIFTEKAFLMEQEFIKLNKRMLDKKETLKIINDLIQNQSKEMLRCTIQKLTPLKLPD